MYYIFVLLSSTACISPSPSSLSVFFSLSAFQCFPHGHIPPPLLPSLPYTSQPFSTFPNTSFLSLSLPCHLTSFTFPPFLGIFSFPSSYLSQNLVSRPLSIPRLNSVPQHLIPPPCPSFTTSFLLSSLPSLPIQPSPSLNASCHLVSPPFPPSHFPCPLTLTPLTPSYSFLSRQSLHLGLPLPTPAHTRPLANFAEVK